MCSQDIYNIREAYDRWEDPKIVYQNYYKDRISLTYFYNVWEGKSWPNIHMDVYTKENKEHYKNLPKNKEFATKRYTDEEVLELRKRYVNETAEEIYNSLTVDSSLNTFKSMLNGNSYKHVPIYDKKNKVWKNN